MTNGMNLERLSLRELEALADDVAVAIVSKREAVKAELRERFGKEAEAAGLTLDQVTGAGTRPARRVAAAPKYRHPEDSSKTWTGKGRKPSWLKELLGGGANIEEFEI